MKTKLLAWLALAAFAAFAQTPRNVILFIGDGMSTPQRMTGEEFSRAAGRGPLAMNSLPMQATTRTVSASSLVTDSAAAATAIACGCKTYNGAVGVDKDGRRVRSCAEAARDAGKKVGIVTSVTINHATPAGFYAHRSNRSKLYEIGLDLVASGFDLFAGGGLEGAFDRPNAEGYAGNLYDYARAQGWQVAEGRAGFDALTPGQGRIWYRDGEQALPYAIDAAGKPNPRLPELTAFALRHLDCEQGFFLMVEGGRIDFAGHANEAAANLRDLLELDDAVKVALDWQKTHPDTLVVITGDHETGGMTMGFAGTGYAFYMDRLASQTCSTDTFKERYHAAKKANPAYAFEDAAALLAECYGFKFGRLAPGADEAALKNDPMQLNQQEINDLKHKFKHGGLTDAARRLMSAKAGVGWTSGSHTGLPALTTACGPGSERFCGLLDNTDISKILTGFCAPDAR